MNRRTALRPGCGKRRYRDEIAAKLALATAQSRDNPGRPKTERRAYFHPPCGGWHLTAARGAGKRSGKIRAITPAAEGKPRKPVRDTGPSRLVRHIVLKRDGYQCARCGRPAGPGIGPYSLQHRKARGVGGDSSLPNLVLLCGTATTLCHGEVEARRSREDIAKGYRLESHQDPVLEPVMYFERPDGPGFTAWLCEDGSLSFEAPGEAA